MSGPEHFREAERLLHIAEDTADSPSGDLPYTAQVVAEAQVHATLALAAATALAGPSNPSRYTEWLAWAAAAGTRESQSGESS